MKKRVYCYCCEYYKKGNSFSCFQDSCLSPKNKFKRRTYYQEIIYGELPFKLNKNNNCKFFKLHKEGK